MCLVEDSEKIRYFFPNNKPACGDSLIVCTSVLIMYDGSGKVTTVQVQEPIESTVTWA